MGALCLSACTLPPSFPPPPRAVAALAPTVSLATPIEVAPFVVAPHLQLHSGSPDGRYIAFWQSDNPQPLLPNAPMRLRFYDIKARRLCEFPFETNRQLASSWMGTVEEFKFIADIIDRGDVVVGKPCDGFDFGDWPSGYLDGIYSPNGNAYADTYELTHTNGIVTLQTIIAKDNDTSSTALLTYTWSIDERLGAIGMGGQWVSDETFLIYETHRRQRTTLFTR